MDGNNPNVQLASPSQQDEFVDESDNAKVASLPNSNVQLTPSQTLPQYRPSSGSIGSNTSSTGRMRRNGSMRRSLLFVSGSGMQLTSPTAQTSSNQKKKSPYISSTLSQSSDALLSNAKDGENFPTIGRDRANSYGAEILLNVHESPESSTVRNSEETNHPLIITKNLSERGNRVFTPTPSAASDSENKVYSLPASGSKLQSKRSSSFSNRSLLLTPNAQPLGNFVTSTDTLLEENEKKTEGREAIKDPKKRDNDVFEYKSGSSPINKEAIPLPVGAEDDSSEVLSKLAAKEAGILETKSELEELKKLLRQKEEQLREEQKQLESLKQEMALKLMKNIQSMPEENNTNSNKLQFNNVSESVTNILDKTKKSAQSLVANVNTSFEQKQESNPAAQFMNMSFEEELHFPTGNSNINSEDEDLDDVIYSLNSPVKAPQKESHKEEKTLKHDLLDLNFSPKDDSSIQESLQNQNIGNTNHNRKPQRSKSRMSMYFNKTVSLMSQFDQMLQSELEKKMGIDEEEELEEDEKQEDPEEILYDLPPKPEEIDSVANKSSVRRQHSRSLSSYRFFG